MIKIREWKSLKAVPSLQFGGGLRLVAHLVPYRGSMKCIHSIISLYPSSYKPPNFSPSCSTTRSQKNYLERPQSIETRKKKQDEQRKLNRKKWKGNLLIRYIDIRDGGLKDVPPGEGGGGEMIAPRQGPQENIMELVFLLSQVQLISK